MSKPISISLRGRKVERLYRILLTTQKNKLTWYRIAKLGDVSYGWAHRILNDLQEKEIIEKGVVKKPHDLFEIWSGRKTLGLYREYHIQMPQKVLKDANMKYALTTYFAEQLIGNYLFPRKYDLYILPEDAHDWHIYLAENGYVGKGNVRIILSDEHVFWDGKTVENWPVVSLQQLIVDLLREGAECTEAADILISRFYNEK